MPCPGTTTSGLNAFIILMALKRIRDADKGSMIAEAFHRDRRRRKHDPLLGQPNRAIRLAVNVLQIMKLQGPLADIKRHLVADIRYAG